MTTIGKGTVLIVPKFNGLAAAIKGELGQVDTSSAAQKAGGNYSNIFASTTKAGFAKSGAIVGAFSALTQVAMSTISASVGDAASRFDTLNNYPTVMQSLGYSAQDASESLSKMDEHLQGLPTSLDSMVSTVQGIASCTGDLDQATEAGLALNDMLLASGANTQIASAAAEQFRQMLSKGKPDMQDWKSLISAAPGQMNQLAESMLGAGATANDLYTALGGGGAEATLSMNDLLNAMIRLDQEGGSGFSSFEDQARTASNGVQTSIARIQTAVTRGLADTMKSIGRDNISSILGDVKSGIDSLFSTVNSTIGSIMPTVMNLVNVAKNFAPNILTAATTLLVLKKNVGGIGTALTAAGSAMKNAFTGNSLSITQKAINGVTDSARSLKSSLVGSLKSLASPANIASIAIAGVATAVSLAVTAYQNWKTNTENAEKATTGLADAVSRTGALDTYAGKISNIGSSSQSSAKSIEELNSYIASSVDTMNQTSEKAETQIATLNTAQDIIRQCAGQTDLSSEAQGRLQWAIQQVNEQLGLNINATDVANNSYQDQDGQVRNLCESLDELIEKKKQEVKVQAATDNYSESLKVLAEAEKTYASEYQKEVQERANAVMQANAWTGMSYEEAYQRASDSMGDWSSQAKDDYEAAKEAVKGYAEELGLAVSEQEGSANAYVEFANNMGTATELLKQKGHSVQDFANDLNALGADTEKLNNLSQDQLMQLANAYDGTSASIVPLLREWGIDMDDTAQKSAEASATISNALSEMGITSSNALNGIDLSTFSQKLADAGVSTETLNSIGSANLQQLAQNCNGNIDQMIWAIQNYNNVPTIDKNSAVYVNDVELIDSQGRVYVWNGTSLVDKSSNATVNDIEVQDAQGRVYTWNGSSLEPKSTTATVDYSEVSWFTNWWSSWVPEVKNAFVNVVQSGNGTGTGEWATGGIRLHADGGIIPRYHANGGNIVHKAVPLDIVGEDGAEAIVPLTNRKYSQPFIDLLAEGINDKLDIGKLSDSLNSMSRKIDEQKTALYVDNSQIIAWLASNLPAIIEDCTPVMGEKDFNRRARKAVKYA